MDESRLITIKDVAKDAGVSAQTVSNVINTPQRVRPDTRNRVHHSIQKLGYKPNASARRLRTSRSDTVALGIHPADSPIFDRFLHALTAETDMRDLRILLYKTDTAEDEISHFESLLATSDVDAFILTDVTFDDPRPDWLGGRGRERRHTPNHPTPHSERIPQHRIRWVEASIQHRT